MTRSEENDEQGSSSNALKDITFGSIAGMTAKVFEHPFDLVKVRLQSQATDRPPAFKGPADCFKQTWGREGWKGLYRGVSAPLVGAAAENACLFLVYNKCQDLIRFLNPSGGNVGGLSDKALGKRRELSLGELAVAAGGAGAAASFVLTPIELIKCRMQVQMLAREGAYDHLLSKTSTAKLPETRSRPYTTIATSIHPLKPPIPPPVSTVAPLPGPLTLIKSTIAHHGIRGLWLGQMGTLLRETGGSSAWFSAYEIVSRSFISYKQSQNPGRKITKKDLATWQLIIAGACAGMSYNLVLFPADSIKSSMQTEEELRPRFKIIKTPDGKEKKVPDPPKFFKVGKEIWKRRGLRGLYAGCGLTVARAAPSSAMIFLIYENLETRFGKYF